MDTTEIRGKILRRAVNRQEDSRATLTAFAERFAGNPLAALQWCTEQVVASRVLGELATFVRQAVESERTDVEVFTTLKRYFGQMQHRVGSMAKSLSTSTNAVANEIQRVQLVTLAEAVDDGGWLFETTAYAVDALGQQDDSSRKEVAA